jgi:hypothetical protein
VPLLLVLLSSKSFALIRKQNMKNEKGAALSDRSFEYARYDAKAYFSSNIFLEAVKSPDCSRYR